MAKIKAHPTVKSLSFQHALVLRECHLGDIIYIEKNHSKYHNAAFNVKYFLQAIHVCYKIPVPNKL